MRKNPTTKKKPEPVKPTKYYCLYDNEYVGEADSKEKIVKQLTDDMNFNDRDKDYYTVIEGKELKITFALSVTIE